MDSRGGAGGAGGEQAAGVGGAATKDAPEHNCAEGNAANKKKIDFLCKAYQSAKTLATEVNLSEEMILAWS